MAGARAVAAAVLGVPLPGAWELVLQRGDGESGTDRVLAFTLDPGADLDLGHIE